MSHVAVQREHALRTLSLMPKRSSRVDGAEAAPAKRRGEKSSVTCIVCGLYAEGKAAVTRCLLKELESATVIASDLKAGRAAVPKKVEVTEYKTETPRLPPDASNVVVLPHDLARPSRLAAAMASDKRPAVLLTVLDARSFLDDWESGAEHPLALAAKKDVRAHLHDQKACVVLAECVESADVIALSHADSADTDELEMLEAMLRELNPSAAVVRRDGEGEGGGKLLVHLVS